MRDQYASIPTVAEDTAVRFFCDAGPATVPSPDTKIMAVNSTVINRLVAKAFQSSAFQSAVERAVNERLADPRIANDVATCTIDFLAPTVREARFVKNKIEKCFIDKTEVDG